MAKGLYIHIPFCIKKCAYCDFVSFTSGDFQKYLDMLFLEMEKYKGEEIDTVFIGGGTPTVLSAEQLERLFEKVNSTFNILPDSEITVEANPGTLTVDKLKALKKSGVNRLSIGVQSFNDNELKVIGRIHSSKTAIDTINLAKEYFDNINIDLISALPESTKESFFATLKTAVSLGVQHISCYSLILEESTPLFKKYEKGELNLPDEDLEREMYDFAVSFLEEKGFNRYEISNFAKSGKESRHNLKYWNTDDYIGLGISAHSLISGVRYENTCDLEKYLSGEFLENSFSLTDKDRKTEYIIMRLRLKDGIDETEYKNRFLNDFYNEFKDINDKYINLGLMKREEGKVFLTLEGVSLSNTIMSEYV